MSSAFHNNIGCFPNIEGVILCAASYGSLSAFPEGQRICEYLDHSAPGSDDLATLRRIHFVDPAQEQQLFAALKPSTKAAALEEIPVAQQYENYPYPCWISCFDFETISIRTYLRKLLGGAEYLPEVSRPLKVLIAGCGTGKHAIDVARQLCAHLGRAHRRVLSHPSIDADHIGRSSHGRPGDTRCVLVWAR